MTAIKTLGDESPSYSIVKKWAAEFSNIFSSPEQRSRRAFVLPPTYVVVLALVLA